MFPQIDLSSQPDPLSLADYAPVQRAASLRLLKRIKIAKARRHPGHMIEYIFGVKLAPFHWEWLDFYYKHDRGVLEAARGHAKSTIFSVGLPLFEIGNNPNLRIAIVSATAGQSEKLLREIGYFIQHDLNYREIFGNLYDPLAVWTQRQKTVRRSKPLKDSSFLAIGQGSGFAGARSDILLLDDIVDAQNSLTVHRRRQVLHWIFETALPTLDPTGPQRALLVGTPYHFDDALFHLQQAWPSRKYPAWDTAGQLLWPERFTHKELDRRREEARLIGREHIFFTQYLLRLAGSDGNRLLRGWLHESPGKVLPGRGEVWGVDWAVTPEDEKDVYSPDYSVISKFRIAPWGLELYDLTRIQAEAPDVIHVLTAELEANGNVHVLGVEQNGIGKPAMQMLARTTDLEITPVLATGSLVTRMNLMAVDWAAEKITLARDATEIVQKQFIPEWLGFPFFSFDDCLASCDVARRAHFESPTGESGVMS